MALRINTRRAVPRYRNVPFELAEPSGDSVHILADDASTRSARFHAQHAENLDKASGGHCTLDSTVHGLSNLLTRRPEGRDDVVILEYESFPRGFHRIRAWATRLSQFFRPTADDELRRYRKPTLLRRLLRLVIPERVSRIHLYEAQERYVYLLRLLDYYEQTLPHSGPERRQKKATIMICRRALRQASVLLNRRQSDLNFLWRELTQVHTMMLNNVLPDDVLPAQLDFCREEQRRLALTEDPEVKEWLQRVAETMDESGENRTKKVRLLRALIERFNGVRTGRIHEQLVTIRCYQKALYMFAPIGVLLLLLHDLVLKGDPSGAEFLKPDRPESWGFLGLGSVEWLGSLVGHYLHQNILAFVFFSGLIGGFFSVITRLRSRELVPGEDAYFLWYVLTKPWIGALGAAVLFILLKSGVVSTNILGTSTELPTVWEPGPVLFAVGFLSGFSERIVFPQLHGAATRTKRV